MTIKHIIACISVFMLAVFGWVVLGSASTLRSSDYSYSTSWEVRQLWGDPITQSAPSFSFREPGSDQNIRINPASNTLVVDIQLEQRRKGLFWYPTYQVDFSGEYRIENNDKVEKKVRLHFPLPSADATYDNFSLVVDGEAVESEFDPATGIQELLVIEPANARTVSISYRSRGLQQWQYLPSDSGRVKNLDMTVTTNFDNVDFPSNSLSPMQKSPADDGLKLSWLADDLITKQNIGVVMPEKLNPGPLSAKMTFFAPVCLLFFFVLLTAIGILRKITIHPMHYLFVASGFFAFHLLFAYLIDLINVHLAFGLSAVTSMSLVVFYLRSALGDNFPWKWALAGQFGYLILFSYSFFIEGMTGLTVTIGSIATLALMMKLTSGLNWSLVFQRSEQPDRNPASIDQINSQPS